MKPGNRSDLPDKVLIPQDLFPGRWEEVERKVNYPFIY